MSWLTALKLKSKLLISFGLCALITVAVAILGQFGVARLYGQMQDLTSNSLVSIQKTDAVKLNTLATNRDLFKLIVLTAANANADDINAAIQSYRDNQADAMSSFKAYRATPLENDERAAGDDFERDWPLYIAAADSSLAALKNGDVGLARKIALDTVTPAYKKIGSEWKSSLSRIPAKPMR